MKCELVPHCRTVRQFSKGVSLLLIMLPKFYVSHFAAVVDPVGMWVTRCIASYSVISPVTRRENVRSARSDDTDGSVVNAYFCASHDTRRYSANSRYSPRGSLLTRTPKGTPDKHVLFSGRWTTKVLRAGDRVNVQAYTKFKKP